MFNHPTTTGLVCLQANDGVLRLQVIRPAPSGPKLVPAGAMSIPTCSLQADSNRLKIGPGRLSQIARPSKRVTGSRQLGVLATALVVRPATRRPQAVLS